MNRITFFWIIGVVFVGFGVGLLAFDPPEAEYILLVSKTGEPNAIGSVQVGLNKVQAEGAAFQLNETLKEHGIPLVVKSRKQISVKQRRQK